MRAKRMEERHNRCNGLEGSGSSMGLVNWETLCQSMAVSK